MCLLLFSPWTSVGAMAPIFSLEHELHTPFTFLSSLRYYLGKHSWKPQHPRHLDNPYSKASQSPLVLPLETWT